MPSTQHQLIEQCAIRLRGIVEALDNIHDTIPHRWSTDLDDVHSSAESLLAMIKCQTADQAAQVLASPPPKCATCGGTGMVDDGEITCSEGGIPYENGPVKCVKDCPACKAQPSPVQPEEAPVIGCLCGMPMTEGHHSPDGCSSLGEFAPHLSAQAQAQQAERPEVVGYLATAEHPKHGQPHKAFNYFKGQHDAQVAHWRERGCTVTEDQLMTVSQHDRIVGALRAKADQLREALEWRKENQAGQRELLRSVTAERDAALARVAELEGKLTDWVHEGFRLNKALAVAQAQHSGPEEFSFEYRHPNGESHTVTVSRAQVINEMPDFMFEALCSKFCNCEPVGETNVVECCCDEYAEEFKLLAAAPGKEGV